LRRIVEALDAAGIPYALAGGLAVSIYTTPRATEDIDLLVARGDLDRAVSTLQPAGFRPAGRPMPVAGGRLEIQRLTKIEGTDLLPLDLLIPTDPALTALIADRASLTLEGRQVDLEAPARIGAGPRRPRSPRPEVTITARDVSATLRKVSALRALCLRLPHLPTPKERTLLRRFEILVAAPQTASADDTEALAVGWRQWWREERRAALLGMAQGLPAGLVERDRRLASYADAARGPR
jgi:hypothetical protein